MKENNNIIDITFDNKHFTDKNKLLEYLIIYSIKQSYQNNPLFIENKTLTLTVFTILKNIYINKKKIIFLDAPTGTGKSIIGYMIHFSFNWIERNLNKILNNKELSEDNSFPSTTYTLTSSKILQEQFENDFKRFEITNHFSMLKGQSNYECKKGTQETGKYTNYVQRSCIGIKKEELETLPCFDICEYIQKRRETSISPSAVINYSYFLTVLNSNFNVYFEKRKLTIADEGHLIPQIISNMFSIDLSLYRLNKLNNILTVLNFNFNKTLNKQIDYLSDKVKKSYKFFTHKNNEINNILDYIEKFKKLCENFMQLVKNDNNYFDSESDYNHFNKLVGKEIKEIYDTTISEYENNIEYLNSLKERPEDLYISFESIGVIPYYVCNESLPSQEYYRISIRDLSEAELVKKYFIDKTDVLLIMSATIGNVDDFGKLLGLKTEEYVGFNLPSEFDYSHSPIYLCNSGYLNYNSFQDNIHKVINDTWKILTNYHSKDKGIIHTSTFRIAEMLKEFLHRNDSKNYKRYLFYQTPEEKEKCIELIKNDLNNEPYVLIGPSLYEGIDLKDDLGRFNIVIKAPYSGLDDYTRKKMERFPFWYERETLEKLQQAIGRTNRHKNDWSKVYLLDNSLNKLIWKLPNYITKRVQTKKL